MNIKIETKPLQTNRQPRTERMRDLIEALKKLKVGESFLFDINAQDRQAISIVQFTLDRQYRTAAENGKRRVARVR